MEGQKNLNAPLKHTPVKTDGLAIFFVVLFHVVGLIGFLIAGLDTLFLKLVPWHLLLMTAIIIACQVTRDKRFFFFMGTIFLLGFLAEFIGVHTGWLFGQYKYGDTLGIKLFGIPLMIGVNWFLLIYSTGVTLQHYPIKNPYLRVLCGAAILTVLDVLIEPVAIHFDYWHWVGKTIPLTNYICWFGLSAAMLVIFDFFKFKPQGKVAIALLLMQFIFFMLLGLVY